MKTSFAHSLTIALIILKLCHVITWSWWFVFAPEWMDLCVAWLAGMIATGLVKALLRKEILQHRQYMDTMPQACQYLTGFRRRVGWIMINRAEEALAKDDTGQIILSYLAFKSNKEEPKR